MKGKEKCRALKEIRRQIAEANDISLAVSECTYQGECRGTCPRCESELRYLERELALRQSLGKAVAVVGLSAGICASVTACSPTDPSVPPSGGASSVSTGGSEELAGQMIAPYEEETSSAEKTNPGEAKRESTEEVGTESALPEGVEGELELAGDIAPYEPGEGADICGPDGNAADE